jgi:hypothetical protein
VSVASAYAHSLSNAGSSAVIEPQQAAWTKYPSSVSRNDKEQEDSVSPDAALPMDEGADEGEQLPDSPQTGPVTVFGRWADRVAMALFLSLVIIGTWNWVGPTDVSKNLSDEDLATLEELKALRNIEVGEELAMTDTSPSRWVMDYGFEPPEVDGTWISSRKAKIVFSSNDGGAISAISLGFFPFVADQVPSRALTIKTSLGETEVLLTGGGQAVSVPLDGESSQEVEINCDSIDAPVDLGISPDVRTLCTKLLWVRADR